MLCVSASFLCPGPGHHFWKRVHLAVEAAVKRSCCEFSSSVLQGQPDLRWGKLAEGQMAISELGHVAPFTLFVIS